ncbi:uncharacterized protein LOC142142999 isoform X2 [Mixophyes fleayi]|uniref:uncharacterized protein LOC142142999 isoform X2 n=1 Tax=Mixophyes fleayi TaxID=3061075 RepID=UPI003F4DDAF5
MRPWLVFYQLLLLFLLGGQTDEDYAGSPLNINMAENQDVENESGFRIAFNPSSMLAFVPARSCHVQFRKDFGTFSPPVFYGNIDVNLWCNWTILAAPGKHIVIYITGFQTNIHCNKNHDEIIFEGVSSSVENSIVYACWNKHTHVFATEALAVNVVLLWRSFSHSGSTKYFNGRYYVFDDPVFEQPWNLSLTSSKPYSSTSDEITILPKKPPTKESPLHSSVLPKSSISKIFHKISTDDSSGFQDDREPPSIIQSHRPTFKMNELLTLDTPESDLLKGVTSAVVHSFSPTYNTSKTPWLEASHSYEADEHKKHTDIWTDGYLEPSHVGKVETMSQSVWISKMASPQLLHDTPNLNIAHTTALYEKLNFSITHATGIHETLHFSIDHTIPWTTNLGATHVVENAESLKSSYFSIANTTALSLVPVELHDTPLFSKSYAIELVEDPHFSLAHKIELPEPPHFSIPHTTDFPGILHFSVSKTVELTEMPHSSIAYSAELLEMPHPSVAQPVDLPSVAPTGELTEMPHPSVAHSVELLEMPHPSVAHPVDLPNMPLPSVAPTSELIEMPHSSIAYSVELPEMPHPSVAHLVDLPNIPLPSVAPTGELIEMPHSSIAHSVELQEIPHASVAHPVKLPEVPHPSVASSVELPHMPHPSISSVEFLEMTYPNADPSIKLKEMPHSSVTTPAELTDLPHLGEAHHIYFTESSFMSAVDATGLPEMSDFSVLNFPLQSSPEQPFVESYVSTLLPMTKLLSNGIVPSKATETHTLKHNIDITDPKYPLHPTDKWQTSTYLEDPTTTRMIIAETKSTYSYSTNSDVDLYQKESGQPKSDFVDDLDTINFSGNRTYLGLPHVPGDSLFVITAVIEHKDINLRELETELVASVNEKITDRMIYFLNGVYSLTLKEIQWTNINQVILTFWLHLKQGGDVIGIFLNSQLKTLESHPLGSFNATLVSFLVEEIYSLSDHLEILIGCVASVSGTLLLLLVILCIIKQRSCAKAKFSLQDRKARHHSAHVRSPFAGWQSERGQALPKPTRHLSLQRTAEHYSARETASTIELTIEQTAC